MESFLLCIECVVAWMVRKVFHRYFVSLIKSCSLRCHTDLYSSKREKNAKSAAFWKTFEPSMHNINNKRWGERRPYESGESIVTSLWRVDGIAPSHSHRYDYRVNYNVYYKCICDSLKERNCQGTAHWELSVSILGSRRVDVLCVCCFFAHWNFSFFCCCCFLPLISNRIPIFTPVSLFRIPSNRHEVDSDTVGVCI